jgi:hypothetical protein
METDWQVTAVNSDSQGLEFVSSFEHKRHPFYGVQFHPEKNAYEWKATNNNPHTANAILVEQFFANFLVTEGKRAVSFFLLSDFYFFLSRVCLLSPVFSLFASFISFPFSSIPSISPSPIFLSFLPSSCSQPKYCGTCIVRVS